MFNLSRYFSTVSLILIVMAAGVLGPLYRWLATEQMTELAEHRNVAMAQVFENLLYEPLNALMRASLGQSVDFLQQSTEAALLRTSAVGLLRNTSMVKVKIYNRLGITVFSSDPAEVGENQLENAGFRAAMRGEVVSELIHRNSIGSFDGVRADLDLLSSYVPIIGRDQSIEGVFELYQDVTPFIVQLQRGRWWVTAGVFVVFGLLYFMQFLVVRRAQRILMDQEGRIMAACDTLELQVDARTKELKRSNSLLKSEIAERRQVESKLNYLAYHDPLTGLANRRCFMERLEESLGEAGLQQTQVAVLFIDLDQFKQVNDSLGHGLGDELLVSVAARLTEHLGLIDMLARLGGDEFICLMEGVRSDDELVMLAGEIIGAFEYSFRLGEHELFLSASVGISRFPDDARSVVDLMRNADTAMYRAKATGRGQFHFYTPEMTRDAQVRIRMENLLRRALDNGELAVFFQPQIETVSGRLLGAEALLRWHSPELGEVTPSCFIPLAEDTGIIIALGNWVLRETCRQVMAWRRSGFELAQVSVNLSVKQLERPEFFTTLGEILDETGMEASCLKLELTESVVMRVGTEAFTLLQRLRDFGISLALDDFGTGYSSLSYLKSLPVQQLKIDQSFVMGIGQNVGDEAIIRTVIQLAGSLGLEVVAEGVETAGQADFLGKLGCQQLQGYLHGHAVAPDEFRARWSGLR